MLAAACKTHTPPAPRGGLWTLLSAFATCTPATQFHFVVGDVLTGVGIYVFWNPVHTLNTITYTDFESDTEDISTLATTMVRLELLQEAPMQAYTPSQAINVFTKFAAILAILLSVHIYDHANRLSLLWATVVQVVAVVHFAILMEDDRFVIIREWFAILFFVLGTLVPVLFLSYKLRKLFA